MCRHLQFPLEDVVEATVPHDVGELRRAQHKCRGNQDEVADRAALQGRTHEVTDPLVLNRLHLILDVPQSS